MENKEIETLLKKYQEGTATEAEKAMLESWYLQRDLNTITELSAWEFSEDLALIGEGLPLHQTVRRVNWWPRIAAVAAVLAIFFAGYLAWPFLQNRLHPTQLTALNVPGNKKEQVALADGSKVWVNSGSELKYPKQFNGKTREVYLSGEAYFDIQHDASKPFIIHTGNVITTVLGTAFNIKEDKNRHTIVVTVTRGKVSVANGAHRLGIITPNQQISFNVVSKQSVQTDVDAAQVIAWQKNNIYFDDITFADAAAQLQQKFKVNISFKNDKLKNCRFTGTSLHGDNLAKILKVICAFNNATYKTNADGSILIDGPGCN
jgi:transmembrane sensor